MCSVMRVLTFTCFAQVAGPVVHELIDLGLPKWIEKKKVEAKHHPDSVPHYRRYSEAQLSAFIEDGIAALREPPKFHRVDEQRIFADQHRPPDEDADR